MHPDVEHVELGETPPIPVKPVPEVKTTDAEYCAWITYSVQATDPEQKILPYDKKRHKTRIYVIGTAVLGSRAQIQNGKGGTIINNTVEYTAAQELWLAPGSVGTPTVTVQDERY